MNDKSIQRVSGLFKVLSDPTRLRILDALFHTKKDLCVNEIAYEVGISQSAASHQLAKLESNEIVRSVRDGQKVCYVLQDNNVTKQLRTIMNNSE